MIEDMDLDARLSRYKQDIQADAGVTEEQRDHADEDMRFANVDGGHWEGFAGDRFDDRVRLQIDFVHQHLTSFKSKWNANRMGVEFKPDDDATNDDDAEFLTSMYRADFRAGYGQTAVDTAVDEAATSGFGAFQIFTEFVDESDPDNPEQRIVFAPIHNAYNSVIYDSAAQREDKRDARRCTIMTEFTRDSFEQEYPGSDPVSAWDAGDRGYLSTDASARDSVFIAKRYEVIKKKTMVWFYENLESGQVERFNNDDHKLIEKELKASNTMVFSKKRMIKTRSIEVSTFSGTEFLEEPRRIAGQWIGVVPVYGYRGFVNGAEWYRGLVRKLKDPQRLLDIQISQIAENAASGGQRVPIFDPSQMQNPSVSAPWGDKNNQPYLLASALRNPDQSIAHIGPLGYSEPATLDQNTAVLLDFIPAFFREMTGGAMQDTIDPATSGKALNAIAKREDLNTQEIMDNIATSLAYAGDVYQSLVAETHDPSRTVGLLGPDGAERRETLSTIVSDDDGRLIVLHKVRGKKFRAYADSSPQYDTAREQTVEELKGVIAALSEIPGAQQDPEIKRYINAAIHALMQNMQGLGLDPIKKIAREAMVVSGAIEPETEEEHAMLEQAQQPQEDPQAKLIEAAAEQASAEARERDSKALVNTSTAELNTAKTAQVITDIENDRKKTDLSAAESRAKIQLEVLKNFNQLGGSSAPLQ